MRDDRQEILSSVLDGVCRPAAKHACLLVWKMEGDGCVGGTWRTVDNWISKPQIPGILVFSAVNVPIYFSEFEKVQNSSLGMNIISQSSPQMTLIHCNIDNLQTLFSIQLSFQLSLDLLKVFDKCEIIFICCFNDFS